MDESRGIPSSLWKRREGPVRRMEVQKLDRAALPHGRVPGVLDRREGWGWGRGRGRGGRRARL